MALSPVKPRRMSVTPAAIQIRVLAGIILAGSPTRLGSLSDRRCQQRRQMHGRETRYEPLPLRTLLGTLSFLLHAQARRGPPPAAVARPWAQPRRVLDLKAQHDIACANEIPGWRSPHAHAPQLPPRRQLTKSLQLSGAALPVCETAA